jgi:hypothetical protein
MLILYYKFNKKVPIIDIEEKMKNLTPIFTALFLEAFAVLPAVGALEYNPPFGVQTYPLLGFPALASSGGTAAPNELFSPGPYSITLNPALTAPLQRFSADLGYSGVLDPDPDPDTGSFGHVLHLGFAFPSRWGVFTVAANTAFSLPDALAPEDTVTGRLGIARDITERFYAGAALFGGIRYDAKSFALAGDLGVYFKLNDFGSLKNITAGLVLSNLGKTFNTWYTEQAEPVAMAEPEVAVPDTLTGVPAVGGLWETDDEGHYPAMFTPKAAIGAKIVETQDIDIYGNASISVPSFQDFTMNLELALQYKKSLTVQVGWGFDVQEIAKDRGVKLPSVSMYYKLEVDAHKNEFMTRQGWQKTDLNIGTSWTNLGRKMSAFSAGVAANFGSRDTDAPEVEMWGE